MKHDYSSTQINLSQEATETFLSRQKSLISKADLYKPDSGRGLIDDPHVTILTGLHEKRPSFELMEIIETYPKIAVTLGNVSIFKSNENNNPFDLVKVDVQCPDLHVLRHAFMEVCESSQEFPYYIPHVTIAFVKPDTCDHLEGLNRFHGISFISDCVVFSGQDGTHRRIFLGQK